MGNQHSRLDHRSASTIGHFDTIKTLGSWQENDTQQDPYQRHYLLPTISPASSDGRIKLRKQSSPTPALLHHPRKPLARLLPFRSFTRDSLSESALCDPSNLLPVSLETKCSVHPLTPVSSFPSAQDDQISVYSTPPHQPKRESWSSAKRKSTLDPIDSGPTCVWISGRKFHHTLGSSYLLPCDDEEVDRLHLQHFMVRFAIQGNYLAPVSDMLRKGAHVLDVGCGPGSWTMEIAGEYPKSTIVGIDINAMFPREIKPSNSKFYHCNILEALPFDECSFDYVFMRGVAQGVKESQWAPLIADLVRVLKPGGWIELVETDSEMHRVGPITREFNQHLRDLMTCSLMDPHAGPRLNERLTANNDLSHITTTFISCPGGQWAGKLGQLTLQSWKAYYQALRPQICLSGKMTSEVYEDRLQICWREADEYKTFENVHFAYAQKKLRPLEDEE
ncbi:S-adenosyl-L-methionine-dependent methyltransferase [Spinellus fusiger]|nr:S-adenosyl-L-methionine-dependent methyltransferase [Spinellus fusiger]